MQGPRGAIPDTPFCHALRIPSVLYSIMASQRPIPSIVRNGIDVAGIAELAWARRRGAVLARVWAVEDSEDSAGESR